MFTFGDGCYGKVFQTKRRQFVTDAALLLCERPRLRMVDRQSPRMVLFDRSFAVYAVRSSDEFASRIGFQSPL